MTWAALAPLLADIGRVLQFAEFLAMPAAARAAPARGGAWTCAAQRELGRPGFVAHVAGAARRLLVLSVARGWPTLVARARPSPHRSPPRMRWGWSRHRCAPRCPILAMQRGRLHALTFMRGTRTHSVP
jgi:hypothetical protein